MKYLIIREDNVFSDVFETNGVKDDKLNIKYSNKGIYTDKALDSDGYSLECTGEGYLFTDHAMNKEIFLDYSQIDVLRMMYRAIEGPCKYRSFRRM